MKSLALSLIAFSLAAATVTPARAQDPAQIQAEQARAVLLGDTIKLLRVPTVYGDSRVRHRDLTLRLEANPSNGVIRGVTLVESVPAAALITQFVAGRYQAADGCEFQLSGPGVQDGGRTGWVLSSLANTCDVSTATADVQANWTTGPVAGHPSEGDISGDGCTVTGATLAYGTGSSNRYLGTSSVFTLRASSTGSALSLDRIGSSGCAVVDTVSFTLCPGGSCG